MHLGEGHHGGRWASHLEERHPSARPDQWLPRRRGGAPQGLYQDDQATEPQPHRQPEGEEAALRAIHPPADVKLQ